MELANPVERTRVAANPVYEPQAATRAKPENPVMALATSRPMSSQPATREDETDGAHA